MNVLLMIFFYGRRRVYPTCITSYSMVITKYYQRILRKSNEFVWTERPNCDTKVLVLESGQCIGLDFTADKAVLAKKTQCVCCFTRVFSYSGVKGKCFNTIEKNKRKFAEDDPNERIWGQLEKVTAWTCCINSRKLINSMRIASCINT